jgi:hypothetical protein
MTSQPNPQGLGETSARAKMATEKYVTGKMWADPLCVRERAGLAASAPGIIDYLRIHFEPV